VTQSLLFFFCIYIPSNGTADGTFACKSQQLTGQCSKHCAVWRLASTTNLLHASLLSQVCTYSVPADEPHDKQQTHRKAILCSTSSALPCICAHLVAQHTALLHLLLCALHVIFFVAGQAEAAFQSYLRVLSRGHTPKLKPYIISNTPSWVKVLQFSRILESLTANFSCELTLGMSSCVRRSKWQATWRFNLKNSLEKQTSSLATCGDVFLVLPESDAWK